MASLFGSSQLLSLPITRTRHATTSSSQIPPPSPPPQPPSQPSPISVSSPDQLVPLVASAKKTSNKRPGMNADSTDWIASSLTRRFGLGAGLAWAAFLAVGVVSEQIKTRIEVSQEAVNTRDVEKQEEVVLPNGLRYYDLRVGGGASPKTGDLVVIGLRGVVQGTGQVFVNTFGDKKKPLALVMGRRPYTRGMCEGLDYVMRSMKAGGKRSLVVPPNLGFGDEGADLGSGIVVPPNATLEYIVEVDRVSIAPA
ncbi:unnamed protein product [Rhodiola kirilowii]